ncbi:ribosomal RNA processing protein 1 homolog B-like isoform X2 [Ostrea edulis]|uniref:ribosomal RNA processing protein 1 homolog B-like isoform X2 n=1 Tax=Ostrea edulis TaxID=37623 RepID=UPI0024AF924E|nr:ribosomal RNA processing protein 1 homolog B-like isoform X2 [Ostrea edulis]
MAAPCPTAEVHFAQKLAANEKRTRDTAFKKLKKWLQSRSSDGKEADFLKIWKGLHYCMWMQDKPLIQEELSDSMCKLLSVFGNVDISLMFLGVFFQTESREWSGIDRWRMDKFMMLSREMLGQSLVLLKKAKWKKAHLDFFGQILKDHVLMAENDGYKIHITDIYLDELEKAGAEVLSPSQIIHFLEPFSTFLVESKNTTLVKRVISRIFDAIIQQTVDDATRRAERLLQKEDEANNNGADVEDLDEDEEEDDTPPRLDFDYGAIADRLFELGKNPECLSRHRTLVYNVVKKFRDLNEGALPTKVKDYSCLQKGYINREDFAKSVNKLISMETEVHRQKKKRKNRKRNKDQEKDDDGCMVPNKKKKENSVENKNETSVKTNSETPTVVKEKMKKETGLTKLKDKLLGKRKKERDSTQSLKKAKQEDSGSGISRSVETPVSRGVIDSQKTETPVKVAKRKSSGKISSVEKERTPKSSQNGIKDFETPTFDEEENYVKTVEKDTSSVKQKQSRHSKVGLDTLELKHIHDQEVINNKEVKANALEEEVEIWVPNKKYSGKLKKQEKSAEVKKFAQFEHGAQTPPAYVKKSSAKLATPKTEPGKASKKVTGSEKKSRTSKRKVTFDMKKNKAVGFKKSIQFSPSPFNPDKRPEQGILKTPDGSSQETPDGTPSASSRKITRQPTPHVKTRGVKRTPSSVKKLRTPTSVQKYTGTPIPNKAAPVMRLVKSPRAKAADYF